MSYEPAKGWADKEHVWRNFVFWAAISLVFLPIAFLLLDYIDDIQEEGVLWAAMAEKAITFIFSAWFATGLVWYVDASKRGQLWRGVLNGNVACAAVICALWLGCVLLLIYRT